MAGRNIEEYTILLRMVAESDPQNLKKIIAYIRELRNQYLTLDQIAERVSKGIKVQYRLSPEDIAKALKEREEQLKKAADSSRKLAEEEKRLAEAEKEVTAAAEEQGGVLSWLIGGLQQAAGGLKQMIVIAGGILLAQAIMAPIRKVWEITGALVERGKEFVAGVKDISATMELYRAQLTGLLGGAREAAAALAYLREVGFEIPLVDIPELLNAIKMLTAFGLNYQKWLLVIGSVSAATGKDIATIVNAIGMISAGNVRYGLYYLERAGIDLKWLSTEGKSAQQVLEELFEFLSTRYGKVLPEMVRTWEGSVSTLGKLWWFFREELGKPAFEIASKRLADFVQNLVDKKDDILAFASVLGEYPARALQRFLDFIDEIAAGIDFKAQDFFKGAVNLGVSFADGLLTALDSYVLPAIVGIADLIASFLLGTSPPPRGPLSRVYEGAMAVMRTYLLALKEGVDFQTLNEIAGFIQAALTHAVSIGDLSEAELYGTVLRARQLVAQAIGQMRALGGVSPAISGELAGLLGPIYQDVQNYLGLLRQLQAATDAVTAAQERLRAAQAWVAEATKRVEEAQDRLRHFEIETAEIPERFTRGRRRQLELAIQEAEEERKRRQEAVSIAQEQLRVAQDQVRATQEQISLQRAYLSELERIWRLQEQQAKAEEESAEALGDWRDDLKDVPSEIEEIKKKWRPVLDEIFKDFERLEKHWQRLGDFIRGFLGIRPEVPPEFERERYLWRPSEEWREGQRFKEALEGIATGFNKIAEASEGARKAVADFFEAGPDLSKLREDIEAFKTEIGPELQKLWTVILTAGLFTGVGAMFGGYGAPVGTFLGTIVGMLIAYGPEMQTSVKESAQGLIDTIKGLFESPETEKDIKAAGEAGIKLPLVDVAKETKKELVGRSIFPDMIKEIVRLFRDLPWKLYPHLVSLYTTITLWIRLSATSWRLELASMTSAVTTLIDALEDLIDILLRLGSIMGGATTGGTTSVRTLVRHAGGPIFRTGQYQLEAGEWVLNREQRVLAGLGAGAGGIGATYHFSTFVHNWPDGVDKMKRRQLEKIVKKGAMQAIDELMRKSGRD